MPVRGQIKATTCISWGRFIKVHWSGVPRLLPILIFYGLPGWGAFSLVMGRHVNHADTSNLPFSYLIEQGNTTYLVPGVNLRSVGTIRDAQKWPKRDKRTRSS